MGDRKQGQDVTADMEWVDYKGLQKAIIHALQQDIQNTQTQNQTHQQTMENQPPQLIDILGNIQIGAGVTLTDLVEFLNKGESEINNLFPDICYS